MSVALCLPKKISNEEYEAAYRNKDNRKVIRSVLAKFGIENGHDSLDIIQNALVRTLLKHDPKYEQKFTTSLYNYTRWECRIYLRKQKSQAKRERIDNATQVEYIPSPVNPIIGSFGDLLECVVNLPPAESRVIRQYFFEKLTLREIGSANNYSRFLAHATLKRALANLKEMIINEVKVGNKS